MKTASPFTPGPVHDEDLYAERHLRASAVGRELVAIARELRKQFSRPRRWTLENPAMDRLVELFTLYEAGEMTPAAARAFERAVDRHPVLGDHLSPLQDVWNAPLASLPEQVSDDEIDASFSRLMASVTKTGRNP